MDQSGDVICVLKIMKVRVSNVITEDHFEWIVAHTGTTNIACGYLVMLTSTGISNSTLKLVQKLKQSTRELTNNRFIIRKV